MNTLSVRIHNNTLAVLFAVFEASLVGGAVLVANLALTVLLHFTTREHANIAFVGVPILVYMRNIFHLELIIFPSAYYVRVILIG